MVASPISVVVCPNIAHNIWNIPQFVAFLTMLRKLLFPLPKGTDVVSYPDHAWRNSDHSRKDWHCRDTSFMFHPLFPLSLKKITSPWFLSNGIITWSPHLYHLQLLPLFFQSNPACSNDVAVIVVTASPSQIFTCSSSFLSFYPSSFINCDLFSSLVKRKENSVTFFNIDCWTFFHSFWSA